MSYYVYGSADGLGAIPGGPNFPGLSAIPGGPNYPGFSAAPLPGGRNYPGFGAVDFSAAVVWSDWLAGAKGNNAAGKRAADTIRAALGQLGYGPVGVGGMYADNSAGGAMDKAAYTKFATANGVAATPGMPLYWPNQAGLQKLEELVKAGGVPGGGPVQEFHTTPAGIVSGPAPGQKALTAGLSTGAKIALAAAAAAGLAAVVLMGKKKPAGSTALALSPATRRAMANW